jgi:hypothetical protein
MGFVKKLPIELLFWISAIAWLANINPYEPHFSFCLFSIIGFEWCPGCGIGHAISMCLHRDFNASFSTHPLGLFGLMVIIHRIIKLIINQFQFQSIVNKVKIF